MIVVGAGLAVVVVAALVLLLRPSDDLPETSTDVAGGVLFVNGSFVAPPYLVETIGGRILVDGALALEFEELEAPTRVEPPTDPANAEELAAVAAGMLEAAGWPERLPTEDEAGLIAQDVAALPSAAEVTVEEGTLRIVDQDGAEERLLYWVRPPGDRPAHEDLAQSMAAGWSRTLGEGGVLIVTGQAILSVPAVLTEAFMQDLTAAFEAGSGRDAALDELIGSPSLSASLSDTTVPPELGARFAPQQSYPSMQLVAFQPRSGGSASPPDPLSPTHYDSRTPKSDRAYIVAPVTAEWFQKCAAEGTRLAANLHGYKLYEFWGKAATMEELVAASGRAGIMHVCSHGNVSFGPYSKADADARVARLAARGTRGAQRGVLSGTFGKKYYVMGGSSFLMRNWRDAGTIVIAEM